MCVTLRLSDSERTLSQLKLWIFWVIDKKMYWLLVQRAHIVMWDYRWTETSGNLYLNNSNSNKELFTGAKILFNLTCLFYLSLLILWETWMERLWSRDHLMSWWLDEKLQTAVERPDVNPSLSHDCKLVVSVTLTVMNVGGHVLCCMLCCVYTDGPLKSQWEQRK